MSAARWFSGYGLPSEPFSHRSSRHTHLLTTVSSLLPMGRFLNPLRSIFSGFGCGISCVHLCGCGTGDALAPAVPLVFFVNLHVVNEQLLTLFEALNFLSFIYDNFIPVYAVFILLVFPFIHLEHFTS